MRLFGELAPMTTAWALGLLAAVGLLLLPQLVRACGRAAGVLAGVAVLAGAGGGWWLLGRAAPEVPPPADWAAAVTSDSCAGCHADHYDSWHRTFHRTMTRDASPETVKGDFADAVYDYQGLRTRFTREGDEFWMETVAPEWAALYARAGGRTEGLPRPWTTRFRVERLVGSHWIQECLGRERDGRYFRLPVLYYIVEHRWIHSNGAFLAPDTDDFWEKCRGATWNTTCLYCHNTGPSQNPVRDRRGAPAGYRTEVAELGIACEACHGPGGDHVRANHNPARRFAVEHDAAGDPSIVNPPRLPLPLRDAVCAHCHGANLARPETRDPRTLRDPFVAGHDLARYFRPFHSESEQRALANLPSPAPPPPDGRFWPDGTPLTTALEYNGLALSACYQGGRGNLSCLTCHVMHGDDPNFLLKPGMQTNEACYQCHEDYRGRLAAHTHHATDSPGSLCYNCHMPHLVYSLLTTHRSHRIETPDVAVSASTGKPHACNLCHLDKSLGWTQEQLAGWSDRQRLKHPQLSEDDRHLSHALLLLARADARGRVMVAGAFSNPDARQAAGTDWFGPFLTRLMEPERYPAVRYLAQRGLRRAFGESAAGPFDYLGKPADRAAQLRALRARFDAPLLERPRPHLPLTFQAHPDEAVLRRLLGQRHDPDLTINE